MADLELVEAIGSGGMAHCLPRLRSAARCSEGHRGHAAGLCREAACSACARFERPKPETMAVLDHPSIVRVYDVGSNDETAWIVMELVEGRIPPSEDRFHRHQCRRLPRYTARVLEALDVAHRHGVVHRDIKPHNVLLTPDGEARITDFGIARSAGQTDESFTKTGTVMGTWAFMAPEQRVNAKGVDHTADIYGLGASLFAMATGQTPMDLFAADLDPEMLASTRSAAADHSEGYPVSTGTALPHSQGHA